MKNKFSIGSIVTLKSHPLLIKEKIQGDGKLVPPFMVVKEIFFEDKKKRTHSEELGKEIADKVKYTCAFFDDNKTEFKEVVLYESMLLKFPKDKEEFKEESLEYQFGEKIAFKTNILEVSKERESKKTTHTKLNDKDGKPTNRKSETITTQNLVNFSSPDFVLCGIKKNESLNDFYPNGDTRRKASETLFKVKWFNSFQMKFSEIYLPAECFTAIQPFEIKAENNKEEGKE
jgi:hypothetical protein